MRKGDEHTRFDAKSGLGGYLIAVLSVLASFLALWLLIILVRVVIGW